MPSGKKFTPKKLRVSIRKDGVNPSDYNNYNLPWSCEDCSHFAHETKSCTIGYDTRNTLREIQKHSYELSGKFAVCRCIEID